MYYKSDVDSKCAYYGPLLFGVRCLSSVRANVKYKHVQSKT
jgi:hypothetical protein